MAELPVHIRNGDRVVEKDGLTKSITPLETVGRSVPPSRAGTWLNIDRDPWKRVFLTLLPSVKSGLNMVFIGVSSHTIFSSSPYPG